MSRQHFQAFSQMKTLKSYISHERAVPLDASRLRSMVMRKGLNFLEWVNFKGSSVAALLSGHKGVVVLLHRDGGSIGHYVLFARGPHGLEYFDSYGLAPDRLCAILGFSQDNTHRFLRVVSQCATHHRVANLQARQSDTNTCGRYAVCRFNFLWATTAQFAAMMRHPSLSPDDVVTLLTLSADLSHWASVLKDEKGG
jgi:hypothetical protein